MPQISYFLGVIIRMFYRDHYNTPHFLDRRIKWTFIHNKDLEKINLTATGDSVIILKKFIVAGEKCNVISLDDLKHLESMKQKIPDFSTYTIIELDMYIHRNTHVAFAP